MRAYTAFTAHGTLIRVNYDSSPPDTYVYYVIKGSQDIAVLRVPSVEIQPAMVIGLDYIVDGEVFYDHHEHAHFLYPNNVTLDPVQG